MGIHPIRAVRARVARHRIEAVIDGIESLPMPTRAAALILLGALVGVVLAVTMYYVAVAGVVASLRSR